VATKSRSASNTQRIIVALLNRGLSNKESTACFANVSHDDLVTRFTDYLNKHRHFLGHCHIEQSHALNDKGVDIILRTDDAKIGFQIKSHFDVAETEFAAKVKRQLAESFIHSLDQYIILICSPLEDQGTSYAAKISHLLNELSHMDMKMPYHSAYGPMNTVQYFLNPSVVSRDELLLQKAITNDALHEYEKGFEHLPEIGDAELQAASRKCDAFGDDLFDTDEGRQAYSDFQTLWNKKQAAQFVDTFLPTVPEHIRERRVEMTTCIQNRLMQCRNCKSWDDKSEYKLRSWLEWLDEDMIPFTSLPNLIRLKSDIDRYYNIHAAMDEQMRKQNKNSPYDLDGQPSADTLSEKAQDLLLNAASDKLGIIMIVRTTNGMFVQTNNRQFMDAQDARSEAEWQGVVEELVGRGYVEKLPEEGESFTVTATGYSAVDGLRDIGSVTNDRYPLASDV
jgi:hypothetical protein